MSKSRKTAFEDLLEDFAEGQDQREALYSRSAGLPKLDVRLPVAVAAAEVADGENDTAKLSKPLIFGARDPFFQPSKPVCAHCGTPSDLFDETGAEVVCTGCSTVQGPVYTQEAEYRLFFNGGGGGGGSSSYESERSKIRGGTSSYIPGVTSFDDVHASDMKQVPKGASLAARSAASEDANDFRLKGHEFIGRMVQACYGGVHSFVHSKASELYEVAVRVQQSEKEKGRRKRLSLNGQLAAAAVWEACVDAGHVDLDDAYEKIKTVFNLSQKSLAKAVVTLKKNSKKQAAHARHF